MKINCLDHGFIELIDSMGNDQTILTAAGECFGTSPKEGLIIALIKSKHTSVLEHVTMQFKIKLPLFLRDQWVRHRIGWSYSIKSLRYCKANLEFYIPDDYYLEISDIFLQSNVKACLAYQELLSMGVSREQARIVLPTGLYTEMICTCNLASLYHFLELRLSPKTQKEMREYAKALLELSKQVVPIASAGIEKELLK